MNFDSSPFTCSCAGEKKKNLNNLKFGTFIGRFSSDDAASMAVKGLIGTVKAFHGTSLKQ